VDCANGCSSGSADTPSRCRDSATGREGDIGGGGGFASAQLKSIECEVSATRFRVPDAAKRDVQLLLLPAPSPKNHHSIMHFENAGITT
jgi:hypothetical protein